MIRLLPLLFALLLSFQLHAKEYYKYKMGIVAIFQNDAPYLKEWIEFHRIVGVEHFWLYNNGSQDDYMDVLQPYIAKGIVELFPWGSGKDGWDAFCFGVQPAAYEDAIYRAKRPQQRTKWLAVIDTDEFLFPVQHEELYDCLEEYFTDCSGVCVNWQIYGTSHVGSIPPMTPMTEALLYKAPTDYQRNTYYKSIVQPAHVIGCTNPHYCIYKTGYWHVNTDREQLAIDNNKVLIDKLRINHYWTRDEDYMFNVKVPRYDKWANNGAVVTAFVEELNQVYDDAIIKYVPELQRRLASANIQ